MIGSIVISLGHFVGYVANAGEATKLSRENREAVHEEKNF